MSCAPLRSFTIELEKNGRVQSDTVFPDPHWLGDLGQVQARELTYAILETFGENSPVLDYQPASDEDSGWVLEGKGPTGHSEILPDNKVVYLDNYRSFKATPRTVAGIDPKVLP